jgi:1,4-dihydroxy-2-naphthoate octaprenyltransferase
LAEHPEATALRSEWLAPRDTDDHNGLVLVKLIPEHYAFFGAPAIQPAWEYATEAGRNRPSQRSLWTQAMRFFSLSFTVLTALIGAGFALSYPGPVRWDLLPLILLGAFALHVGSNLTSEYFDYREGVDRPETLGGTRLLVEGWLSPRAVFRAGLLFFALGVAIGLYIAYRVDWWILLFGLAGLAGGFFYGASPLRLKYRALGELAVFVCFGLLMVVGSYYALTDSFDWQVALAAVPIGFLITAVLSANNTRDIGNDAKASVTTLPIRYGLAAARVGYAALVVTAYSITVVLVVLGAIPVFSLVVLISVPLALKNVRDMLRVADENSPTLSTMDVRTAQLVTQFGVLFFAALVADRLL